MTKRRTFLKTTGGAAAAVGVASYAIPKLGALPAMADFAPLTGKKLNFAFPEGGPITKLALEKVEALKPLDVDIPGLQKEPFSLVFSGKADQRMPNRDLKVSGEGLDEMDMTINMCRFDEKTETYYYEAVFG